MSEPMFIAWRDAVRNDNWASPFEGPNPFIVMNSRIAGDPVAPRKRNPQISEQLEEIILHAMEREPSKRYQTAADRKRSWTTRTRSD